MALITINYYTYVHVHVHVRALVPGARRHIHCRAVLASSGRSNMAMAAVRLPAVVALVDFLHQQVHDDTNTAPVLDAAAMAQLAALVPPALAAWPAVQPALSVAGRPFTADTLDRASLHTLAHCVMQLVGAPTMPNTRRMSGLFQKKK